MWQFQVNSVTDSDSRKEKFEKLKILKALPYGIVYKFWIFEILVEIRLRKIKFLTVFFINNIGVTDCKSLFQQ